MVNYYLPGDDLGKSRFMNKYSVGLRKFMIVLGFDEATVKQVEDDTSNFDVVLDETGTFQTFGRTVTTFKNLLRDGADDGSSIGDAPVVPVIGTFTDQPLGNIFGRLAKQVQLIKSHPKYTVAIGTELGIIGAEKPPVDPATIKPVLSHSIEAGKPNIIWKRSGHDGVHVYVDRGDGKGYGTVPYTDNKPDFLDDYQLPSTGQSALWKYKAIYIDEDVEVGTMSNELSVTVSGIV